MSPYDIFRYLSYISALSVLIPISVFAGIRRLTVQYRILLSYLVLSALADGISYYIVSVLHTGNALIFHGFRIVEVLLLSAFYFEEYKWGKTWCVLFLCIIASIRLALWSFIPEDDNFIFNILSKTLLTGFGIYYFLRLFDRLDVPNLFQHAFFWINCAILFYFGVTLLIGIFEIFIKEISGVIGRFLWAIQLLCNTFFYFILAVGLWKKKGS